VDVPDGAPGPADRGPEVRTARTETPSRAVGYGGAFTAIYPVKGAGGYQLFGRTPIEVLDVDQELAEFEDSMVLPNPGDILNYRRIDRDEYDAIREEVEDGSYEYNIGTIDFRPEEFFDDPEGLQRADHGGAAGLMINVLDGGLSTTVQDTGRFGHYHIGMPPSGAMDQYAHTVANYIVGNDEEAATLEMTYAGPDLEFEEDAVIAATGADMQPTLNDEEIPTWTAVQVEAGDVLSFQFATEGVRSYLAVAGGIDVPKVMESRSTYTLIGIGGHEGRDLDEGDTLPVGSANGNATVGAAVDDSYVPDYANNDTIRVVMGLCDYRLTDEGRDELLGAEWKISDEADRVGCRLTGPDIEGCSRNATSRSAPARTRRTSSTSATRSAPSRWRASPSS